MVELRVFLVRHNLRQEDLAEAVGLSRVAISNIINGKSQPTRGTINLVLRYCRQFDPAITYEVLFGSREAAA